MVAAHSVPATARAIRRERQDTFNLLVVAPSNAKPATPRMNGPVTVVLATGSVHAASPVVLAGPRPPG